jgi:hypothetical protein
MKETLEITASPDLLNEFLGQQEGAPEVTEPTSVITDGGTQVTETITPKPAEGLEIMNELPEGFNTPDAADDTEGADDSNQGADETARDSSGYSFKALAGYLSEEGIIDFEDAEGLEDSPEVLFESVKKTIDKQIQEYKNSIPDKAKQLIDYLEKGGTVDNYINALTKPFDVSTLDLESESDQERAVREYLRLEDYSQEEIDEMVDTYSTALILDKQAKVAVKQLDKHYSKVEQNLLAQAAQEQEARQEQYQNYISTVNTTIDTADAIAGLPITPKEKADFKRYLLQADKEGFTPYAREVAEDPIKTQLELAYLKFMKYDFSKAIKVGETQAARKYKDIFKSNETNIKTGKSIEEVSSNMDLSAFSQFRSKK